MNWNGKVGSIVENKEVCRRRAGFAEVLASKVHAGAGIKRHNSRMPDRDDVGKVILSLKSIA